MDEALRFFRAYEIWIYVFLALGGLVTIRWFILSWEELRGAAFGLERERAQAHLNQSAGLLVLILGIGVAVFILVSFVSPLVPGSSPISTPTLALLTTATGTLPADLTLSTTPQSEATLVALPPVQAAGEGCVPDQVMLTFPQDASEVSGVIELTGTATLENFGFYKYEIARPGETIWLTIQAARDPVINDKLGPWDTRNLEPGDYLLRLVVTDNQGQSPEPCVVQVRVAPPVETP